MAKLHELLAVDQNLRGQAESCRADLRNTFQKKQHHFTERVVTFRPSIEGAEDQTEEQLSLQTTVRQELNWIGEKLGKALDVAYQVDVANTEAKADVVLDDGTILLTGIPATALLQLEKRVREIQDLVSNIPTLDPAKGFTPDMDRGEGIFRARDTIRPRTAKQFEYIVMYEATEKHPAQIKELNVDKPIGQLLTQEWSSLLTVAQKGDMLDRVEILLRAIKSARSRANEHEVDTKANRIGKTLLNYVFG